MTTLRRYRPGGQTGRSRDLVTPGIHAPCLIHQLSELYDLEKPRHERPSVTHILHSIRVKSTSVSVVRFGLTDPLHWLRYAGSRWMTYPQLNMEGKSNLSSSLLI